MTATLIRYATFAAAAAAAACRETLASQTDSPSFLDVVAAVPGPIPVPGRRLGDEAGNSYSYLDDLTGQSVSYGTCIRVKIPQENDDDGNAYFYNGNYHAPSAAYASFYLCEQNGGGNDQCGACDYGTQYAMELGDFLQSQVGLAQNYCGACGAQCGRRRRAEEDEDEGENEANGGGNFQVNCKTCVDECALMLAGNEGNDETYYVECQESHQDENGIQYYSGPACDPDTGGIAIGLYYDEDCTIKSQMYDNGFAYNTFGTIEDMCIDCSNDGACDDLYGNSYHCFNGRDQLGGGDDDMPVCKTFKQATKEWTYAPAKSKNKAVPIIISVLLLGALGGIFAFLSYSYYIRHKRAADIQVPMASLDHDNTIPEDAQIT
uniref:Uncharacterized protein n=1 Tax=Odontella aurita TaxID=265563 RepID=A0A7S4MV48_9STRA|mmetsp:Transcript_34507/g.103165  ORF Transcript_34507/g.103165 Transcript_34507/m.103165 type:complete len:377 (+) Transcript_34507:289-1419(+)|eukprot:CAMPEP_0113563156 /NCGR_PEP_ID=MMETSP0015_2-20120614/20912_1 /TAXON_ID=2838 /ORGANISM="Odontella" /LENGTH=376 /DNA_ID=CAMNT_0000465105 /DNA_START=151 /DNA_END=1281 /DNA_ORIENTATION=+ /assembly_acc=CAM_ASM_000160